MTNATRIMVHLQAHADNACRTKFCRRIVLSVMKKLRDGRHWRKVSHSLISFTVNELEVGVEWETPNEQRILRTRRAPVRTNLGNIGDPQHDRLLNSAFADAHEGDLVVLAAGDRPDAENRFRLIGYTKTAMPCFSLHLAEDPLYLSLRFGQE